MTDALLALLRETSASVALLVGANTLTTVLALLGATALAVAAAALVARSTRAVVLDVASLPAVQPRGVLDDGPFATQSDPDAPGSPRPRAPGLLLG